MDIGRWVISVLEIIFILCITVGISAASPNNLAVRFGPAGLQSIRYFGTEFLARGSFVVNAVSLVNANGRISVASKDFLHSVSAAHQSETMRFTWGEISTHYLVRANALLLNIETINQSDATIGQVSFDVLALRFPQRPLQYDGVIPMLGTNLGQPTLLPLTFGKQNVLLCNEDLSRPLLVGFPWALNRPADTIFPLRINTGRDSMYPDSLPNISRPIPPGGKDQYSLSLRFGEGRLEVARAAPDLLSLFAKANPFALQWPDRRPIGSLIIGTAAAGWPKNPRGWFLDRSLNVTSREGVALFQRKLLAWADRSIAILRQMNAQGMITWDIEGEQFAHPTTYIGDPRLAGTLAPEIDGVLDEYFRRFVRAGFRVGVTIRPQNVIILKDKQMVQQSSATDPAQVLIDKIGYARKRWGATLFYIDSNGDPALPLSFSAIKRVAEAFPDVLLMPEHKNAAYYSRTAPYAELRGGSAATPSLVRAVYPDAFSVINTADGNIDQQYSELQQAVARGDILMFRAWYEDPANGKLRGLLRGARQ